MPQIRHAFEAGNISVCAIDRRGRLCANPPVRELMIDGDNWFTIHITLPDGTELR